MVHKSLRFIAFVMLAAALWVPGTLLATPGMGTDPTTVDAKDLNQNFLSALKCIKCHQKDVDAVKASAHFRIASPSDFALFPGGGAHGMFDRACSLPGSTSLINYSGGAPEQNECAKCHISRYMPGSEQMIAQAMKMQGMPDADAAAKAKFIVDGGIDCMVCHATTYKTYPKGNTTHAAYAKLFEKTPGTAGDSPSPLGYPRYGHEPDPNGLDFNGDGKPDMVVAQDRSPEAILSMGKTTTKACLRCHEHDFSGYKRGTPFDAEFDVHAANFKDRNQCTHCHKAEKHKFQRGNNVNGDFVTTDYGHKNETLGCTSCHKKGGEAPIPDGMLHSETHLAKMACETCHNPMTSGITYSVWANGIQLAFGRNPKTGMDTRLITLDALINDEMNAKIDHDAAKEDMIGDIKAYAIRPVYMWFDKTYTKGVPKTSFLAQPLSTFADKNAKIAPFKPMGNGLVFDQRFFVKRDAADFAKNDAGVQFSRYSMYNFYAKGKNAELFSAFGMLGNPAMNISGMLPDAVRTVNMMTDLANFKDPARQAMALMQIFPNMVYFLKANFGYGYYTVYKGHDEADANNDGIIDPKSKFFFDMFKAANAGLMAFKAFNPIFGLPADTDWYPKFDSADDLVTMKLPDGSLMRIYLQLKDAMADDDPGTMHPERWKNYPAFSNGVTLGHAVAGAKTMWKPLGYGENGCKDCHSAKGVMMQPVPVAKTVEIGPFKDFGNMSFQMPVYRWVYYNARKLVALGVGTEDADVLTGKSDIDIAGRPEYMLEGKKSFMLNWLDPKGYIKATAAEMMPAGVKLMRDGGDWVAVLEPVIETHSNWEILGYKPIMQDGKVVGMTKPDGTKMTYWEKDSVPQPDGDMNEPDAQSPDTTVTQDTAQSDVPTVKDTSKPKDTSVAKDTVVMDNGPTKSDSGGGCSTTGTGSAPFWLLLMFAGMLYLRKRA